MARYCDLLLDRAGLSLAGIDVGAVLEEFRRRAVEAEADVVAGLETRRLDRLDAEFERGFRRGKIRREAALVADIGVVSRLLQRALERVKHLRAPAHGVGEGRRADRQDHEFLEVDRVVGMHAAIDDIHLRHRQHARRGSADIAIERQARGLGGGLGDGERHAQDRVGPEPRLVVGAVEGDHRLVDLELVLGLEAGDSVENVAIDRFDRLEHALSAKPALVAVAQFDRLAGPGRSARWNRRSAHRAVFQHDIHFDGRIAAAIQDLTSDDVHDGGHQWSSLLCSRCSFLRHHCNRRKTRRGADPGSRQHFCFRCKTIDHTWLPKKKFAWQGRFAS